MDSEDRHGDQERDQRIGQPPDQDGGYELRRGRIGQSQEERRLEGAEACRNMAGDGEQDSAGEQSCEGRKADVDIGRQEDPERGRSGRDVHETEHDLGDGRLAPREPDPRLATADRTLAPTAPEHVAGERKQQRDAQSLVQADGQTVERGESLRLQGGADAENGRHAGPQGQSRHGREFGHLGQVQAGSAIDAPPHGAGREQRKAERMPDGIAGEGPGGDGPERHRLVRRRAYSEDIVARERAIAEGAEEQRQHDDMRLCAERARSYH